MADENAQQKITVWEESELPQDNYFKERGGDQKKRIESVSVKRRMPTSMPYNSPGDEQEFHYNNINDFGE